MVLVGMHFNFIIVPEKMLISQEGNVKDEV